MAERYTIHDQLGAGGVGTVYRAFDHQLGRWVAIKRLMSAGEAGDDTVRVSELRREADALAALRNPNIVTIYDVASDSQGVFLVMELLDGEDLADVVARGPLHYDDFKELASQTLEALLAAHQRQILHRDIKPENIKVERLPGGRMQSKLIDFGLARAGLHAGKQTEDLNGTVMGSVFYMAPEQLTRHPVDERTDLYSLGAVFYEALSGQKAFDGPTVAAVIDKHVNHEIVPLHVIAPHVPPWLGAWVLRLMARNPDDRPSSAQHAIEEFRAWEKVSSAPMTMPWMPMGYGFAPPTVAPEVIAVAKPVVEMAAQTGALPPRRTTAQVTRPGGMRSSAMIRPAVRKPATQTLNKPPAHQGFGRSMARWLMVGAILSVIAAVAWFWLGRGRAPEPVKSSQPTASPVKPLFQLPVDRVFPPASEDLSLHLVAEVGASVDGRPTEVALNQPVQVWHDLAGRGGVVTLQPARGQSGPVRVNWPVAPGFSGPRSNRRVLSFGSAPGVVSQLEGRAREVDAMPFGSQAVRGERGLTMAVVFQAETGEPSIRLLDLSASGGQGGVSLHLSGDGQVRADFRSGGQHHSMTLPALDARRPCLVVLTWQASTGMLGLSGREANGRTALAKTGRLAAPTMPLGQFVLGGEGGAREGRFKGYLAECLVYASALKADQVQLLAGKQLPDYYFNALNDPKLPRQRPLTERLTVKKARIGPRSEWKPDASEVAEDVWLALDGNPTTRWRTAKPQAPGQWLQVSLPVEKEISGLAMDVACVPAEQAQAYKIEVSTDGKNWSQAAVGEGGKPVMEILFTAPVKARHVRIHQAGSRPVERWGVAELEIFAR